MDCKNCSQILSLASAFYIIIFTSFAGKQKKTVKPHSTLQLQRYNSFWFIKKYLLCTHPMQYKMIVSCPFSLNVVCLPVDCKATAKHIDLK
jgi:hypothetical protein